MVTLDLEELLPLAREGDGSGLFWEHRRVNKVKRYWYHASARGIITSGPIIARMPPGGGAPRVKLTPYELSKLSVVVDITKLEDDRFGEFDEKTDAMFYYGDIPAPAIAAYNLADVAKPEPEKKTEPEAAKEELKPNEFKVPESAMPWLERKFARIQKVAHEVGAAPPSFTVLRTEFKERKKWSDLEQKWLPDGFKKLIVVSVTGEAPKLAGWTFIATLTHTQAGNLLNKVPGIKEDLPERYRNADAWCDYCQTARRRVDSFVVRNDKGEYKQIGRNCLAKFLGFSNPERVVAYASFLGDLRKEIEEQDEEEERDQSSRGTQYQSLLEFLTMVAAVTRTQGWRSRTAARETDRAASVDEVLFQLDRHSKFDRYHPQLFPTKEDEERAKEAIAFARSDKLQPNTDFKHNLKVSTAEDYFHPKAYGVVSALIQFYDKEKEWGRTQEMKQAEAEKRKAGEKKSQHVGTIGQRITTNVRVLRVKELESDWGVSRMHRMVDDNGNILIWFASNEKLDEGDAYKLTGTVKKHEFYNGINQTVLTRCKADPIEGTVEEKEVLEPLPSRDKPEPHVATRALMLRPSAPLEGFGGIR